MLRYQVDIHLPFPGPETFEYKRYAFEFGENPKKDNPINQKFKIQNLLIISKNSIFSSEIEKRVKKYLEKDLRYFVSVLPQILLDLSKIFLPRLYCNFRKFHFSILLITRLSK